MENNQFTNENAILTWCSKNCILHTSYNTYHNWWLCYRSLLWSSESLVSTGYIHCLFFHWTVQCFKWEFQQLPLLSITFYRGWLCMSMPFETFIAHDIMFRYWPLQFNFFFFWISATIDMWVNKVKIFFLSNDWKVFSSRTT